jgi:hypothetical protein
MDGEARFGDFAESRRTKMSAAPRSNMEDSAASGVETTEVTVRIPLLEEPFSSS